MHRTFRTPLIPTLSGASRARMYTGPTTKAASQTQTTDVEPSSKQRTRNSRLRLNSTSANLNTQMKNELMKIQKQVTTDADMKNMQSLEAIHEMMSVYRRYRDSRGSPNAADGPGSTGGSDRDAFENKPAASSGSGGDYNPKVNASDPIHTILTILRLRTKVLKPVISKVRKQIMGSQNKVLCQYLNEIADDLVAGRSYATRFALAYMITAFGTMENDAQASIVWKRLESESQTSVDQDLATRLADPRVVAAAIRSGDPEIVTIGELEETYRKTTEANGRYMLMDEALALSYVKFQKFDKAVEMFASICEHYDLSQWMTSILRLHNQILTLTTDMEIAKTFFETAVSSDSFVQLHPSAASRYIEHLYDANHDPEAVVDVYERASKKLPTQTQPSYQFSTAQCLNMTAEVMKALVNKHYALEGPVSEARAFISRVIAANPAQLCINTVMSYVFKAWAGSSYIVELQKQYFASESLDFDALRVALSSSQSLSAEQIELDQVAKWWNQLLDLKEPQVFDWMSLARACDNPARVDFFVEQWAGRNTSGISIKFDFAPIVYANMVSHGLVVDSPYSSATHKFSSDLVNSELSAHNPPGAHVDGAAAHA